MNRRAFAALLGTLLAIPRALYAQTAKRVYRIAILDDAAESTIAPLWRRLRNRLTELGFVEGDNAVYEARFARGASERLPALAAELVARKPDVILCTGTPPAIAAMKATASIPIVFVASGNPVGAGLVASLARPGGNVTGTSVLTTDIAGKSLELLRELAPGVKRIAYLTDPSNKAAMLAYRQVEENARALKLTIEVLDGRERSQLERSFDAIKRGGTQGLIVGAAAVLLEHRDQIVQFAAREKLPFVYVRREYVDAGGLVSYSLDVQGAFVRSAEYTARILTGAKPADLPVEQSSKLLMVLNLKTARALGIKIPESVRVRVDEVIE